jgi:hypothetical protein
VCPGVRSRSGSTGAATEPFGNGPSGATQRGDRGAWVAQVPIGSKADGRHRIRRIACDTQAAARATLRAARDARDRGADRGAKSQTLGAYLESWLTDVIKRDAEPKTYEGYAYTVGLITRSLGKVPLDKLTPRHVQ